MKFRMSWPYAGMDPKYRGNIAETQDELNKWAERVHRAGIQINCHAKSTDLLSAALPLCHVAELVRAGEVEPPSTGPSTRRLSHFSYARDLVGPAGVEPARLAAPCFEHGVSATSNHGPERLAERGRVERPNP